MVAGVMSGLGAYLGVDVSIIRIGYAALTLLTGIVPGLILYVLMMIIMPLEPESTPD